jgi:polyisoprenoid-binding protein YceI
VSAGSSAANSVCHPLRRKNTLQSSVSLSVALLAALALVGVNPRTSAQTQSGAGQPQGGGGRAGAPAAAPAGPPVPVKIELTEGTKARYKVGEQLAGINFGSEAVGTTEAITGMLVLGADSSVNSSQSKLTVDLRTLKSDQQLRDGYLQRNTLQTDKFPLLEFVPRRQVGLPSPLLAAQRPIVVGFQLVGDMTLHGVTSEVTWNVVATVTTDSIGGRATTTLPFATFGMAKPTVPFVLSVDDKIQLEVEFRAKRTPL